MNEQRINNTHQKAYNAQICLGKSHEAATCFAFMFACTMRAHPNETKENIIIAELDKIIHNDGIMRRLKNELEEAYATTFDYHMSNGATEDEAKAHAMEEALCVKNEAEATFL